MKRNLVIMMVLTLISFNKLSAQCASSANIYSFIMNGKNYEIVKEMKSWTVAAACALQRGGHLIYINSKAEQDSIYNRIIQGAAISPSYTSVGDGGGASYLWIGGTDKVTEGTWKWDGTNSGTGTNFWNGQGAAGVGGGSAANGLYINWGGTSTGTPNEPDDYAGIQDCAAIALTEWPLGASVSSRYGNPSEWNDLDGTNQLYYIIEYETTGMNEINKSKSIELFPNPATNNITFNTKSDETLYLTMFDTLGRIVLKETKIKSNENISIANLTKGIYYYIIANEKEQLSKGKIIKQ